MRKRIISLLCIAAMLIAIFTVPAMADGTRVVTIGQDLSDEQEAFILNYFGVDPATAQVIYVNNQQERDYVGSWIPIEQIGNITISCAYVQPTSTGGINVKTANLTYVTGNMIASVLSTAGVKNCNIVAAAPFPVSGTGALTGVMIAYQQATDQTLDEEKRDLAVQEFTVTQQISESVGEEEALQLVNAVKMEVIQSEVPAEDVQQIEQIVTQTIDNVSGDVNLDNSMTVDQSVTNIYNSLTDEDRQLIADLAVEIAQQEYQYEDVKDTLERVEENLSKETSINISVDNSTNVENDNSNDVDASSENNVTSDNESNADSEATDDEDSILSNTNDELIDAAYQSSTREEDIEQIEQALAEEEQETSTDTGIYDMSAVEEYHEEADPAASEDMIPGNTEEQIITEDTVNWDETAEMTITDESVYTDDIAEPVMPESGEEVFVSDDMVNTEIPEAIADPSATDDAEIPEADADPSATDDAEASETAEEIGRDVTETVLTLVDAVYDTVKDEMDGIEKIPYDRIIRLFVPVSDFRIVSGTITITDQNMAVVSDALIPDDNRVITTGMADAVLQEMGWTEGTEIDLFLPEIEYVEGMSITVDAQSDTEMISVSGNFKSSDARTSIEADAVDDMRVGAETAVTAQLDSEVVSAGFEIADPQIAEAVIEESILSDTENAQRLTIRLLAEGQTLITVHYYGADGTELFSEELPVNVYPAK